MDYLMAAGAMEIARLEDVDNELLMIGLVI
jgi:hypothetical protein